MVCSVGSGKMAVMARLLASGTGSFSQAITEKAVHQNLVAQYIQRELLEADDPNLLDEEDMHIFDLNPLRDPLHLVCCNSCKKPVKASQFVAHAELCKSLDFAEEPVLELEGGTGNRKPPRKERKKLVAGGNQVTSSGAQERFATVDASDGAVSSSQLDGTDGIAPFLVEAKENPRKIAGSAGEMIPFTKRPKLVAADIVQTSDDILTARAVSSCQDTFTYVSAPLMTKAYYSQRSNRLQAAISQMYVQASIEEHCGNNRNLQGNVITGEASSPRIFDDQQFDDSSGKPVCFSPIAQNTDQACTQSSEVSLVRTECQPSNNSPNQFPFTDANASQPAAVEAMKTRYNSRLYSSTSDSGTPLSTIQQPNGSVPVV